jgi:hypothetical protein
MSMAGLGRAAVVPVITGGFSSGGSNYLVRYSFDGGSSYSHQYVTPGSPAPTAPFSGPGNAGLSGIFSFSAGGPGTTTVGADNTGGFGGIEFSSNATAFGGFNRNLFTIYQGVGFAPIFEVKGKITFNLGPNQGDFSLPVLTNLIDGGTGSYFRVLTGGQQDLIGGQMITRSGLVEFEYYLNAKVVTGPAKTYSTLNYNVDIDNIQPAPPPGVVPEPASLAVFGLLGIAGVVGRVRSNRKVSSGA